MPWLTLKDKRCSAMVGNRQPPLSDHRAFHLSACHIIGLVDRHGDISDRPPVDGFHSAIPAS